MSNKMKKMNMQTTNIVDENIKRIGELFPNCLTKRLNDEGKPEVAIDFDQLRQELSKDIVEGAEERIRRAGKKIEQKAKQPDLFNKMGGQIWTLVSECLN